MLVDTTTFRVIAAMVEVFACNSVGSQAVAERSAADRHGTPSARARRSAACHARATGPPLRHGEPPSAGRRPIWMRRMRFPLDLIWIGADARILAVFANVPSCSGDLCPLYEPSGTERSVAVLELSANAAARLGPGTTVRIPTSGRSQ